MLFVSLAGGGAASPSELSVSVYASENRGRSELSLSPVPPLVPLLHRVNRIVSPSRYDVYACCARARRQPCVCLASARLACTTAQTRPSELHHAVITLLPSWVATWPTGPAGGGARSLTWRTMDSTAYITMHTTCTTVKTALVLGQNCAASANAHVASPTAVRNDNAVSSVSDGMYARIGMG